MRATTARQPRIVIVGAGFGGLAAVKALRDEPVDVTIVDQRNHHTFQPLLYQVATAGLDSEDVCYSTRGVARGSDNIRAHQARVTNVDFDAKRIKTSVGEQLQYDILIMALGGVTADFGVPGVREFSFGLKSAADAERIRNHVLNHFESEARHVRSGQAPDSANTTIMVVGGGPTGVEMAGGFAELAHRVLHPDFPELDPATTQVLLVEAGPSILSSFSSKLRASAVAKLTKMGVEVRCDEAVKRVMRDSVELASGEIVATSTVIWAAGIAANPLAEQLGLKTGRGGRVLVDEHLRLPGRPEVYVIGDLAASPDGDELVPQVAPGAVQGGEHAAACILADLTHANANNDVDAGDVVVIEPFRYRDKGSMATIGRNAAVVEMPNGFALSGFIGWVSWLGLHLVLLMGFRNRASVFVNWAWNYLTYDRGSRAVVGEDLSGTDPSGYERA